jgi:hypothetical protein
MYEKPVDWKSVLQGAIWSEFEYSGGKYRATPYELDGGSFIAIHKFVGLKDCPDTNGWAGYQWCVAKGKEGNWPTKEIAQKAIDQEDNKQDTVEAPPAVEQIRSVPSQNTTIDGIPIAPPGERRY